MRKRVEELMMGERAYLVEQSVENFKRRRALPSPNLASIDKEMMFFDRILNVKRLKEFIFITKAEAKAR